jgi:hypothetical protein
MDWNRLKNFKKKFHLVRKAAEAMSQTNINFNIKYEKDKGLNYTLKLPQENEIARFATVLRPLADPSSQLYFKDIASIFLQNNILTIASYEKDNLIKEIQKAELGLIRLNINNESLSALDLYLIYSKGEFFDESETEANKIKELKRNPLFMQLMLFQFYSYSCDVYRICAYLYNLIRQAEKSQTTATIDNPYLHVLDPPRCIYCLKEKGSFKSEEHVYPESLGNTEIILPAGHVCDTCNSSVLSDRDNYLVNFDPISFLRVLYMPYNPKTGKFPMARYQNMIVEKTHPRGILIKQSSDDKKGFKVKENGEIVNINVKTIGREKFNPQLLGRSLYKIALGVICWRNGVQIALDKRYDVAREFILGKRSFPNNLLISRNCVPCPEIEGTHFILESGTLFILKIFGITFLFNLEPEPLIQMNSMLKEMDMQCFPLSDKT